MTKKKIMQEIGVAGESYPGHGLKFDEFLPELRGTQGIKKYREMRENDSVIGATIMAIDMLIRNTPWSWKGEPEAVAFAERLFDSMYNSFSEFVTEVLGFLTYGFAVFEIVAKNVDGEILISKLAPRAQWTIEEFDVSKHGEVKGVWQRTMRFGRVYIPASKMLLFRTVSSNDDPSGRSILRNAYKAYHYASRIQAYEAIAIERELNGIPLGRVPSEYLAAEAGSKEAQLVENFKKILRDVKNNEQGYILLPSDVYENYDGSSTNRLMVDFSLVASNGTRDIDTSKVIVRYQQDMARTVLADFLMLGQNTRGSYAMSKSKSDMFVHAVGGYLDAIATPINRKLLPMFWQLNGRTDPLPKLVPGSVKPVDLVALGSFIRSLSQSGIVLSGDPVLENDLRAKAGLPTDTRGGQKNGK